MTKRQNRIQIERELPRDLPNRYAYDSVSKYNDNVQFYRFKPVRLLRSCWGLFLFINIIGCYDVCADFIIRSRVNNGITFLFLNDIASYFDLKINNREQDYLLASSRNKLELKTGNRLIRINGITVYFSFSPLYERNIPLISEPDFTLLIDPIFRDDSLPAYRVKRIVIDPGHGGRDKGATGNIYLEKNINLLLAKRLQSYLEKAGFTVLLTRSNDTYIPLEERGVITRNWRGDLFISIHCNAAGNKQVTGIETFLVTPVGAQSASKSTIESSRVDGNTFDKLNSRLAYEIHGRMIPATKANDRGIKYHRWQVLREASCPAVLLETGFMSNRTEEQKLANPTYQSLLVSSIGSGIVAFSQIVNARKGK
jgi:N-acetylmuramoyl-L-alanine amidase